MSEKLWAERYRAFCVNRSIFRIVLFLLYTTPHDVTWILLSVRTSPKHVEPVLNREAKIARAS